MTTRSRRLRSGACVVLLVLAAGLPVSAGQFTTMEVVGDSLSAAGAVLPLALGATPPGPPSADGGSSNPAKVEHFAAAPDLDVPAWVWVFLVLPFLAGVIAGYLGRWLADRVSRLFKDG